MRSMELVGRERMEVAVRLIVCPFSLPTADLSHSNKSPFGEKPATMMFRMSPINLGC